MSAAKDIADRLKRAEEKTVVGANVLTPKQALLNADSAKERHPDKHLRWVSLRDPMKVQAREAAGYKVLSTEEGGRRLSDGLILMGCSKEVYEARVKQIEDLNEQRLNHHRNEMAAAVEGVVRVLRDKHGINVDLNRILVQD